MQEAKINEVLNTMLTLILMIKKIISRKLSKVPLADMSPALNS